MIWDEEARALCFTAAKQISPDLGGIFQNEMDITTDHFDQELVDIDRLKLEVELYRSRILMLRKQTL
jgi:hypothetical protein